MLCEFRLKCVHFDLFSCFCRFAPGQCINKRVHSCSEKLFAFSHRHLVFGVCAVGGVELWHR